MSKTLPLWLLIAVLAGCGEGGPKEAKSRLIAQGVPREETFIVQHVAGRIQDPDNFNKWIPSFFADVGNVGGNICLNDILWEINVATGEWINSLAAAKPVYNEDFSEMTVQLRDGIYWSDGVKFTADDLIFTVGYLAKHTTLIMGTVFSSFLDRAEKVDELTVKFHLKEGNSRFHANFIGTWGALNMMPKHIFETVEDPLAFKFNPPVGLSWYTLKSYDPNGYWYLWQKREDWQRTAAGMNYGEPKPNFVLTLWPGSPEKTVIMQMQHDLDHIFMIPPESWTALRKRNEYSTAWYPEYPWAFFDGPGLSSFYFNNDVYPLDNPEVRWALVLATDMVEGVSTAYDGMARMGALHTSATTTYQEYYHKPLQAWLKAFTLDLGDSEPFAPFEPEAAVILAENLKKKGHPVPETSEEMKRIWGSGWWKHSPEASAKLLTKNGFEKRDGKWMQPDGNPFKVVISTAGDIFPLESRLALVIADQWRRLGIDASVQPSETLPDHIRLGNYQIGVAWGSMEPWGGIPDPFRALQLFHSMYYSPIKQSSQGSGVRFKNARVDALIEELRATNPFDDESTKRIYREVLKEMVRVMPIMPGVCRIELSPEDNYYWTNYPSAENAYTVPIVHAWMQSKQMLAEIEPTGRK